MLNTTLIKRQDSFYPTPPFHPPILYPELKPIGLDRVDPGNPVYDMVRQCFLLMGLDKGRAGTPEWNPLSDLVDNESNIVIKPNFVQHYDYRGDFHQLVTHPSVIRPILDYVLLAQGSFRKLKILDSPEIDCILDKTLERLGWDILESFYEEMGHRLSVTDIRMERADYRGGSAIVNRILLPGDPRGFVQVNLGRSSELAPIASDGNFYGADYDRNWTNRNHTPTINRYHISKTCLEADLIINVPKLKTHKKAGITCAMKNLVGCNGDKNLLPHYKIGDLLSGGCEYSVLPSNRMHKFARVLDRMYRDHILSTKLPLTGSIYNRIKPLSDRLFHHWTAEKGQTKGDWWGNDVVWRMILDLNKILLYADSDGILRKNPVRKQLCVVDAIIAGEGEGPHLATPKRLGLIIGGLEAPLVDKAACISMGFDPYKIPQLDRVSGIETFPILLSSDSHLFADIGGDVRDTPFDSLPGPNSKARSPEGWIDKI